MDLNELYKGPLAKVFYIYSWFFTNAFVYYTFGGGLPIMYAIGSMHFLLSYFAFKWLFLRYYSVTYGFDEQIIGYSITLLKWSMFFHLLMILFMYTNKRLLSPSDYTPEEHYRAPFESPKEFFTRRFDS